MIFEKADGIYGQTRLSSLAENESKITTSIKKALHHYSRAITNNPDESLPYYRKGRLFFILKDFENAVTHLTKASALNDNHAETHFYLSAMLFKDEKDPTLAKKHFYKALELNPDFSDAYYELAVHAEACGDISEAKIHFQKSNRSGPELFRGLFQSW